jgi:peroxiredoxin Q/BCP
LLIKETVLLPNHEKDLLRFGLSPQGAKSKKSFREKFDLPFTLLADEGHGVADAYGSWVEKHNYGKTYWGTARTTFLVDPEGRIARVWANVKPEGHAADVLAALDGAQAARVS